MASYVFDYGQTTDGVTVKTGRAAIPQPHKRARLTTPEAPAKAADAAAQPRGITAIFRIPN